MVLELLKRSLNPWLLALLVAALVSGITSAASSAVLAGASLAGKNLLRAARPEAGDEAVLLANRIAGREPGDVVEMIMAVPLAADAARLLAVQVNVSALLAAIIGNIHSGQTGYAWLIDQEGMFIHHPNPDFVGRNAFTVREGKFPFKVLLGAWIEPEPDPAARKRNRAQVEGAVRLANAYPDVVLAVVIGNETQVSWSAHRMTPDVLVHWLREARRGTSLPVSTADDYSWWVLPESAAVARELDFLVLHVHPLWNGQQLERALAFTQEKYAAVAALHPGLPVLLGESGWATRKHVEGEQARLIKGVPGEEQQKVFFEEYLTWVPDGRDSPRHDCRCQ